MNAKKELKVKYLTDKTFKEEIDEKQYRNNSLQQAWEKNDVSVIPKDILKKMPDRNIYFYFGFKQPSQYKHFPKVAMTFLKSFKPNTQLPYVFIFMNQFSHNNNVLWNFRQIFSLLTIQQLSQLEQFIIYKPFFYHWAMDWMVFGTIPKFLKSRTKNINSCQQLCSHLNIPHEVLAHNIPLRYYKQQFPELYKKAIQQGGKEQQIHEEQSIMAKSIRSMVAKPGKQVNTLEDYQMSEIGIPVIFKMLMFYFQTNPQLLKQEGLFRKSISIDEQAQTIKMIIKQNYDYLLQVKNPHVIANLIKRFFVSLKTPIIPFNELQLLLDDKNVQDYVTHLKQVVSIIPELNQRVLLFLINFLTKNVIKNENQNKMGPNNLAICFSPCLLRPKDTAGLLKAATKGPTYVRLMIQQTNQIFGSPEEQKQMYRRSYAQTQKQFYNTMDIGIEQTMKGLDKLEEERTSRCSMRPKKQEELPVLIQQDEKSQIKEKKQEKIRSKSRQFRKNKQISEAKIQQEVSQSEKTNANQKLQRFSFNPNINKQQQANSNQN